LQDSNGRLGLTAAVRMSLRPVEIMSNYPTIKIVSGNEHLVCLTWNHDIFTAGQTFSLGRFWARTFRISSVIAHTTLR